MTAPRRDWRLITVLFVTLGANLVITLTGAKDTIAGKTVAVVLFVVCVGIAVGIGIRDYRRR